MNMSSRSWLRYCVVVAVSAGILTACAGTSGVSESDLPGDGVADDGPAQADSFARPGGDADLPEPGPSGPVYVLNDVAAPGWIQPGTRCDEPGVRVWAPVMAHDEAPQQDLAPSAIVELEVHSLSVDLEPSHTGSVAACVVAAEQAYGPLGIVSGLAVAATSCIAVAFGSASDVYGVYGFSVLGSEDGAVVASPPLFRATAGGTQLVRWGDRICGSPHGAEPFESIACHDVVPPWDEVLMVGDADDPVVAYRAVGGTLYVWHGAELWRYSTPSEPGQLVVGGEAIVPDTVVETGAGAHVAARAVGSSGSEVLLEVVFVEASGQITPVGPAYGWQPYHVEHGETGRFIVPTPGLIVSGSGGAALIPDIDGAGRELLRLDLETGQTELVTDHLGTFRSAIQMAPLEAGSWGWVPWGWTEFTEFVGSGVTGPLSLYEPDTGEVLHLATDAVATIGGLPRLAGDRLYFRAADEAVLPTALFSLDLSTGAEVSLGSTGGHPYHVLPGGDWALLSEPVGVAAAAASAAPDLLQLSDLTPVGPGTAPPPSALLGVERVLDRSWCGPCILWLRHARPADPGFGLQALCVEAP